MSNPIFDSLIAYSCKLLNRRPQSEKEFTQKLTRYVSKKAIADRDTYISKVVNRLKELNLINDVDFAKWYSRERQDFRPRSKRMLSFELFQKGIDRSTIEQTLEGYDEEEAIRSVISRKSHLPKKERISYLLSHGFPYEKVRSAIEEYV